MLSLLQNKPLNPKQIPPGENCVQMLHDFTGFKTEPIKDSWAMKDSKQFWEIMKEMARKKFGGKRVSR